MRRAPCLLRPRAALLALALVACLAHSAAGAGVFELQILEFSNYRLQLRSGACCGGARGACALPCRTRFALCLKEYQSVATPGACSFGRAASPVLGTDSFTLTDPLYTLALNFTFRWTRSFTLILQAYDDFNYTDPEETGLIEEAWWSGIVEPGAAWHALQHSGAAAAVAYRVRVTCQPNHYNSTCTAFCRPRDDKFGHYACSPHGDKRCLPGWQGDNCETPVCKEGCHPTHGRCDKPGDCDCRPGWRGELCAQCQPYPGCKHGYCNGSSWDCTCDTNWGGILCDQDLNYCGTHEPCQHGGTCENTAPDQYLCTCAEGFSGTDCERVDNPCAPQPCAHGACALATSPPGFTCACARGWAGALCDQDVDDCASAPCLHHATCRDRLDAFVCECAPGWTGPTCAEDVDECSAPGATEGAVGPCVNAAACNNTAGGYSCACLPGWTGRDCDVNVDDCTGQCLNGATCIDLVDDFHCACAPGFAGRTCARDIDDCASRPCRNGGECVDRVDAYRCICPVGFSGTDCEDDRDHCAGAPCANGAPCYTAQSDYYCHCAPGWTGKNCTQRQSARDVGAVSGSRGACGGCGAGRCVHAPPAAPHCLCDPGYAGPLCELRVGESAASAGCPEGGCGEGGACAGGGCRCRAGWTGASCDQEVDECAVNPCQNNSTCVDGAGDFLCVCADGWTGKTCSIRASEPCAGGCAAGGVCVRGAGGWRCACRAGRGGARCELPAADACGSAPCRNGGRCVAGAGWWACECAPGWAGPDCARAACDPPCPAPAVCAAGRCICPAAAATDPRSAAHCLELLAGVGVGEAAITAGREGAEAGARCDNGTWWWGCNACWCARGAPVCTRLWCGLPDCLAPNAMPCRTDEVCVPMAPALCLRGPCAALGECRRVWGRRVEPAPLPAPAACVPGARAPAPRGCARARLQLLRERLSAGAHVERACHALRRALAAALLARALPQAPLPPLALLCDLATDDDDALDLAIWVGEEEGADSSTDAATLGLAVRALSELVAHRRLAAHALLGAALRLRVPHDSRAAGAGAAGSAGAHDSGPAPALLALGVGVPLLLAAAAAAALLLRRRRAAAERERRDEEKSNNLQNEENLRRYANPLREDSHAPHAAPAAELPELPRAHALYKACNADARNNTPPARDKDTSKRALPPAPPERLTVLV